ncbi:MAG: hypothetical protein K2K84_08770 [Muribaculaceae bacterium]|nr:hypothetical protein [Muribaculaceae bacterium]
MESNQQQPFEVSGPNPAEAAARYGSTFDGFTDAAETEIEAAPLTLSDSESLPEFRPMSGDLTFGQAFAAARSEMGPGGSFSWRGQVYGTYYRNEWNAMSPGERHDFTLAAFEARDAFENPAEPLVADVEFDDVTEVAVVGDLHADSIVDSDSAFLVDLVDIDEDPAVPTDFQDFDASY